MRTKIFKYTVVGLFVFALILTVQSAKATPIESISIPMCAAKYNIQDHRFIISGLSDVEVFGSVQTSYNGSFALDTSGLTWNISNGSKTITYSDDNGTGSVVLRDASDNYNLLLGADLVSLEMIILDPTLACFEGTGYFNVTGGSLADDFGSNGGLATIGIAFKVPPSFADSFTAMANTSLNPDPAQIPDPSVVFLLGSACIVGGLAGFRRKFRR